MKCAICGKEIKGIGHNPSPFSGTRCCEECYQQFKAEKDFK